MKYLKCNQISVYLLTFVSYVVANRIKDVLYKPIDGVAACFRRHNGTHQFGCSSSKSGNVGVIHIVENETDIQWLEKNSTAGPYTVVLSFNMFTMGNLKRFKNSSNVNGILLIRNKKNERPSYYSPEDTCPNRYSGSQLCNKSWNPYGSSLLLEDWPFPMFYTQDEKSFNAIKSCYLKFNAHNREKQVERSLCALEMKSFMFAALNSESCIKRTTSSINFNPDVFCDPLGDRNIHWPLQSMNDNVKSVIMVIAKLDANSLYEDLVPGAQSTVTAVVTLLAVATYLHSLNATINDTNIVFSLLNGESFDYIGSSRLVYDLKEGNFRSLGGKLLKFDQITLIIELGQLGKGQFYLHTRNFKENKMLNNLKNNLSAEILQNSIPPASIQSFLKINSSLPVVVITNHAQKFLNKYYNSLLDDAEGLEYTRNSKDRNLVKNLVQVAMVLAEELYQTVTGDQVDIDKRNVTFVKELVTSLLPCYLWNANCSMFSAALPPGTELPVEPFSMYVSVARSDNPVTTLTGQLLALLTGETITKLGSSACLENRLLWMAGFNNRGVCINSTANFSSAVSPAFIIDGYDMKSGTYSTYTESVWQTMSMRLLLKPSPATEKLSIILGSIIASLSFIIVWFITSKIDILFNSGSVHL